ncbi:MAG: hypothetical protein MUO63_15430 [Desulfobulbaceae bacterium]|nr:hypothetical protein [Desulfobulbaceae bacterium]
MVSHRLQGVTFGIQKGCWLGNEMLGIGIISWIVDQQQKSRRWNALATERINLPTGLGSRITGVS